MSKQGEKLSYDLNYFLQHDSINYMPDKTIQYNTSVGKACRISSQLIL